MLCAAANHALTPHHPPRPLLRSYGRALATHKFCLAPLGGGHGQRQVLVAFMGCVPVTIGEAPCAAHAWLGAVAAPAPTRVPLLLLLPAHRSLRPR